MNKKILKKYTNIPEQLYVSRSADDQLKMIIEDMQRPGYVLVARQMGKTNLLLNAKRKLESSSRIFTYVDMSNVFETERECYRNIIDNIIETHEELLEGFANDIDVIRTKLIAPHKEYSRSLRKLLNSFSGDIIITLDEIDALRGAEYSDKIFAQIRSTYFSRTNFSEFERLTYILSGVIEPTQLIKDRNKSPFNIGEKIYLSDFTYAEFSDFVIKSNINVDIEIAKEIYQWTKGNPRMTFDIMADIEDYIIEEQTLSKPLISKIINDKYLKTYDIPPIDHIRELVRSNKQIRKAVNFLHKNRGNEIADEVRTKLYLYGITSNIDNDKIEIKNPVIAKAISASWIKSVDELVTDTFSLGIEKFSQKEYEEAIEYFKSYLDNSSPSLTHAENCHFNIGYSYYLLKNYKEASKYFSKHYNQDKFLRNSKVFLGICKLNTGNTDVGFKLLNELVEGDIRDFAYRRAAITIAPLLSEKDPDKALQLYDYLLDLVIDNEEEEEYDPINADLFKTVIYYYKSLIYFQKGNTSESIEGINKAIKLSTDTDSLYFHYFRNLLNNVGKKDVRYLKTISEKKLQLDQNNSYDFSFKEQHLYVYLNELFESKEDFETLLNYVRHEMLSSHASKPEILYKTSINSKKYKKELLLRAIEEKPNSENNLKLNIYRDLALHTANSKVDFSMYFGQYRMCISNQIRVEYRDVLLYAYAIQYNSDKRSIQAGLELCDEIIQKVELSKDPQLEYESVVIYYWYTILYSEIKQKNKVNFFAKKTLEIIDKYKGRQSSLIDKKGLGLISKNLKAITYSANNRKPIRVEKRYGRNERIKVKYTDGKIVEDKYKKLEADIIAKRCEIIDAI